MTERKCEVAASHAEPDTERQDGTKYEYQITWASATTAYRHCFVCGRFVPGYPIRSEKKWLPVCRHHATPFERARHRVSLDENRELTRDEWERAIQVKSR